MLTNSKLYLFKRSNGAYYIGFFEGNRRKWKSTKCRNRSDALQHLRRFQGAKNEEDRTPLLSVLLSRFEALHGTSIRSSTLETYRLAVQHFKEACGDRFIDRYSVLDIEKFKNTQIERHISKVSINIWFRSVKSVLGFTVNHEWLANNPFRLSLQFPIPPSPVYLTKDNFRKLLASVRNSMLRDLYVFASFTGLRLSAILHLTWDMVDLEKHQLTISNTETFLTKTGRVRSIPMHDLVYGILSNRTEIDNGSVFSEDDGSPLLKDHVSKMFKKAVREAGLSESTAGKIGLCIRAPFWNELERR